ncbi:hypothetical protein [Bradyrhizobium jicamae]|uniref:hypothetical protein n=1 Tax=Bradyrhizobium jicamae TaxID=280332 RepID=UPI001BAA8700|nr:hypothetical protein [Bradyrhizobium jicamae]MBR0938224.1 hypothetical protein [Bradyrhizobium jicamae]
MALLSDERAQAGRDRAEGEKMIANEMLELEEMAVKLEVAAKKLPQGPDRGELLRDIARFRAHLIDLKAKEK